MLIHFKTDDTFTDYFKLNTNGQTYWLSEPITVECDGDELELDITLVHAFDCIKEVCKNPFLRMLMYLLDTVLSVVGYWVDNDEGIGLDKGFSSFNPFSVRKRVVIAPMDGETVTVRFTEPRYDRIQKRYAPPDIAVEGATVRQETAEMRYCSALLEREWRHYHVPSFTFYIVLMLLLNALGVYMVIHAVKAIPLFTLSENIFGIALMALIELVFLALLIVYLVILFRMRRICKQVDAHQRADGAL